MNPKIKVRMPKFTKTPETKRYWAKELLLTILATSVSIVLTFGTAYQIERREKANAQRQMAMMIIHDIDMNIMQMEKVDSIIREFGDLQLQIIEGKYEDDINTANVALAMLDPVSVEFPETTELIFNSNVDTWSTIGNVDFIDNVSHCYLIRNKFIQKVLQPFHKKIKPEELQAKAGLLEDYLDIETGYYLMETGMSIDQIKAANNLNKEIMGITDADLEEFIENRKNFDLAVLDSLDRIDSKNVNKYFQMDERKAAARKNFIKNRNSMYPNGASGRNKEE